jgi:hypothetical protein
MINENSLFKLAEQWHQFIVTQWFYQLFLSLIGIFEWYFIIQLRQICLKLTDIFQLKRIGRPHLVR